MCYRFFNLLNRFSFCDASDLAQNIIFDMWKSVIFLIHQSIPRLFEIEVTNKHLKVCTENKHSKNQEYLQLSKLYSYKSFLQLNNYEN